MYPMGSARQHSNLKNQIRLAAGRRNDVVLFNNESGVARFNRHTVRYGVGKGGADLIGLVVPSGRFIALEVKTGKAALTKEQRLFKKLINESGGYCCTVRSIKEAHDAIDRAINPDV